MQTPEVFVVRDHHLLLEAVGARLVTSLVDHIYARGHATLLIEPTALVTDGFKGLATGSIGAAVEWDRVSVWSANSAPSDSLDAVAAALRSLGVPPAHLHLLSQEDAPSRPLAGVAERYAAALHGARGLDDHGAVPAFDIALLAIGKGGSVAGLHPERPTAYDSGSVTVDGVTGEVTLTPSALSTAREVWLVGVGKDTAASAHLALTGGPLQVPAAGARGQTRTLLLLDEPAASALPSSLRRLASP